LNNFYKILLIVISSNFICCDTLEVSSTSFSRIEIVGPEESLLSDEIQVYKDSIDLKLDLIVGYSEGFYTKTDFNDINFNSSLGNLIADILFTQSDSVFNIQENKKIDFVLQNHGGIRSSLFEGDIKLTDIYKILPFENEIVIIEVFGETVEEIITFLRKEINPHPISGLLISPDNGFIQGKLIDPSKKYYISTNDYLLNGGDNMFFLKNNSKVYRLGYSLRDAFIDFTKTNLKLSSKIDNRFLKDE
jgi:2',3'-cyclic-nucleotide 2'-phosphodiesterase (5'-nucleotidase family)